MFAKMYSYAWLIVAATAGIFYITGYMSSLATVVFGRVTFGMTFMGMMCVLPSVVTHTIEGPFPANEKTATASATFSVPRGSQPMRI